MGGAQHDPAIDERAHRRQQTLFALQRSIYGVNDLHNLLASVCPGPSHPALGLQLLKEKTYLRGITNQMPQNVQM